MTSEHDPNAPGRQPHAPMDARTRVMKAEKIIRLVGEARFRDAARLLEIGCGSGVIASTLSELGGATLAVDAVDVVDQRISTEGYEFKQVEGVELPFPDGVFDIVVTNHVIEHVGDVDQQIRHLREIRRVLSPRGIAYLAFPNKWRLLEPHYRLPLLSWLPQRVADAWVRATGRNTFYDCLPPSHGGALSLCTRAGFTAEDVTLAAVRATLDIERGDVPAAGLLQKLPDWAYGVGMPIMPTYAFLLRPSA